jgi:hypothetical protein
MLRSVCSLLHGARPLITTSYRQHLLRSSLCRLSTESGLSSDEATEVDDDDDDDVDNLTAAMMADADEQDVTILPDAFTPSEPVAYSPDSYVPVGRMDPKLLASPALHSTMPYV